ncbi:5'-nucleotidase C-terminal domain-containing protein [Dactylosporangium sp. AC04546]|uniref:bifunctional metallophosphatase/5'-nucleotidase n=1 Tax=Dactylosporangium sp. AC04546 TaxID=2862460 RepID=UPI001EDEEFBD|nr:5'-nucleotidase C-terminal domain-containing protein [Dactylosporangium sp. AC04546]WVK84928.1 5'-nucleotidase C-terminal domain-containing protein [Dactylosporangium sp. AC04546]
MAQPRARGWRFAQHLAVPALAVAVVALLPLAKTGTAEGTDRWTPLTPAKVSFTQKTGPTAKAQILGFNDFHGNIDPPTGSGGLINGTPAGGAEYLSTYLTKLRNAATQDGVRYSDTVVAGDSIGATPLVSAAFHDEPAIEVLNKMGVDISSVGNHEFDEGVTELKRIQFGGCHPTDGCQDGDGFSGANFPYLAANVTNKSNGLPILLPFTIRFYENVPVAYVGMTLEATPGIVNPAGIKTVDFKDEVETANQYATILKWLGIRSMVLLIHEGGAQSSPPAPLDPSGCANFAGPITDIVKGLDPAYGVVISGHTHRFYTCELPNSSGESTLVTSAGTAGTLVTDVRVTFDKKTRKFVDATATNVIVENGVKNPDGTWKIENGVPVRNPDLVDPKVKKIADKYRTAVAPIANKVVGSITADITTSTTAAGESSAGDVIADAQLAYTQSAGAQIAFMNPGGIRAAITYANSPGGEAPGQVTYGECFTVQPFNNLVVTQSFTGAQIKDVLEQQFVGFGGQTVQRILQVSAGLTYTYSASAAPGSKVSDVRLNGTPIDPAATYLVTTNDFLANGGDGFTNLAKGTGRVTAPGFDIDALVSYLGAGPVSPGPQNRITRIA